MKRYVGVWLDRRKAVSVTLRRAEQAHEMDLQTETICQLVSEVEPRTRLSGGSRTRKTPWGPQDVSVDRKVAARRERQLKQYYDLVIRRLRDADRILIMGPGEAKKELCRQAAETDPGVADRIEEVQTCDKMTQRQVAARVRAFFDRGSPAGC